MNMDWIKKNRRPIMGLVTMICIGLLVAGFMGKGPMQKWLKPEPAKEEGKKQDAADVAAESAAAGAADVASAGAGASYTLVRKPECAIEALNMCNDPQICPCGGECDAEADPETNGCRCHGDCE